MKQKCEIKDVFCEFLYVIIFPLNNQQACGPKNNNRDYGLWRSHCYRASIFKMRKETLIGWQNHQRQRKNFSSPFWKVKRGHMDPEVDGWRQSLWKRFLCRWNSLVTRSSSPITNDSQRNHFHFWSHRSHVGGNGPSPGLEKETDGNIWCLLILAFPACFTADYCKCSQQTAAPPPGLNTLQPGQGSVLLWSC